MALEISMCQCLMAGSKKTPEEMYAASLVNAERLERRRKAKKLAKERAAKA